MALCGRTSLQSLRQASHFARTLSRLMNQFAFRHSARDLPLNDSMNALSVGLPDLLWLSGHPLAENQNQQSAGADHERDQAQNPRRRCFPGRSVLSQPGGRATTAHRRNNVVAKCYMNMRPLYQQQQSETEAVACPHIAAMFWYNNQPSRPPLLVDSGMDFGRTSTAESVRWPAHQSPFSYGGITLRFEVGLYRSSGLAVLALARGVPDDLRARNPRPSTIGSSGPYPPAGRPSDIGILKHGRHQRSHGSSSTQRVACRVPTAEPRHSIVLPRARKFC